LGQGDLDETLGQRMRQNGRDTRASWLIVSTRMEGSRSGRRRTGASGSVRVNLANEADLVRRWRLVQTRGD
jgi:hypothetical protein